MGKEEKELLKSIAKELQAQNRLIALQIARNNVNGWGKEDLQIIEEMQKASDGIIEWSYSYPQKTIPLTSGIKDRPLKIKKV